MKDLEMSAIADGLFKYLIEQTESPVDGIAICGMVLLMIFDNASKDVTVAKFAEDFKASMIASHAARSAQGPGTLQ